MKPESTELSEAPFSSSHSRQSYSSMASKPRGSVMMPKRTIAAQRGQREVDRPARPGAASRSFARARFEDAARRWWRGHRESAATMFSGVARPASRSPPRAARRLRSSRRAWRARRSSSSARSPSPIASAHRIARLAAAPRRRRRPAIVPRRAMVEAACAATSPTRTDVVGRRSSAAPGRADRPGSPRSAAGCPAHGTHAPSGAASATPTSGAGAKASRQSAIGHVAGSRPSSA